MIKLPKQSRITHFFAAFAPSVDLAGALPAVEAGAFCAVETGFGGMVVCGCEGVCVRAKTVVAAGGCGWRTRLNRPQPTL